MSQETTQWLLCPPTYFDVVYEINPWMHVTVKPDKSVAQKQWEDLCELFKKLSIPHTFLEPQPGLPDLVFTANGALVKGKKAVLGSFRHPQRQGEEPYYKQWFKSHGYKLTEVEHGWFEGEGDALFVGDILCAGYGARSTPETYEEITEFLEVKNTILCEMVDPVFYHLDTCFAPLSDKQALVYTEALSKTTIICLEEHMELLPIARDEALNFACNCVVHGKNIIIPTGCPKTCLMLQQKGFSVEETDMSQFLKAGGAAKCCSLRV